MNRKIGALRRSFRELTPASRRAFFLSVIQPDLEYAASAIVPSIAASQKNRLLATWRRAVRCAAGSGYQENVAPLVKQLTFFPPTFPRGNIRYLWSFISTGWKNKNPGFFIKKGGLSIFRHNLTAKKKNTSCLIFSSARKGVVSKIRSFDFDVDVNPHQEDNFNFWKSCSNIFFWILKTIW